MIDGDDIRYDGVRYRLDGYDAPELSRFRSKTDQNLERLRGFRATLQLRTVIDGAKVLDVVPLPKFIIGNRQLAKLLVDGRDVADIAIVNRWGCRYEDRKKMDWGHPLAPFNDSLPLPPEIEALL